MKSSRRSWNALVVWLFLVASLAWAMRDKDDSDPIATDERVVFFPTAARRSADGKAWEVPIHGWIFEPEEDSLKRAMLLRLLRKALRLERDAAESTIFNKRARAFLVDNERGKRISIRIVSGAAQDQEAESGGQPPFNAAAQASHVLERSGPNGHFHGVVSADGAATTGDRLQFRALTRPGDDRLFTGEALLLEDEGISVVSDIDDTIRISEVRDRQRLLRGIFCQEFQAVPGMAPLYSAWAARGAAFHYVSAAPWQLYEPLAGFLTDSDFPQGTFHMKSFRLKDRTVFNLFADADTIKRSAIEPLLARYPQRRFVLVGDSGERDPEIYGAIARAHPGRILAIFIRDVTGEPAEGERYRAAFGDLPAEMWRIFPEPNVIDLWRLPETDSSTRTR